MHTPPPTSWPPALLSSAAAIGSAQLQSHMSANTAGTANLVASRRCVSMQAPSASSASIAVHILVPHHRRVLPPQKPFLSYWRPAVLCSPSAAAAHPRLQNHISSPTAGTGAAPPASLLEHCCRQPPSPLAHNSVRNNASPAERPPASCRTLLVTSASNSARAQLLNHILTIKAVTASLVPAASALKHTPCLDIVRLRP